MGFCNAFCSGALRSNDYVFMWSLITMLVLLVVFTISAAAVTDDAQGLMYGVTVGHILLLSVSQFGNLIANRMARMHERIMTGVAFAMLYIAAIVYLFVVYDVTLMSEDDEDLSEADLQEKNDAINFVTGELILVPFVTALITFIGKAYRDNTNGRSMTTGFWFLLVLNFIHGIALVVIMFVYLTQAAAVFSLCTLIFFFYVFVQYVVRIKYSTTVIKISKSFTISPYVLGRIWNAINLILGIGVIVAAYFWTDSKDVADFEQVSFILAIFAGIMAVLTLATFVSDRTRMDEMPIYHSPWIFPIYKYYPRDNDVEPYTSAVVLFFFTAGIVLLWSVWCTI